MSDGIVTVDSNPIETEATPEVQQPKLSIRDALEIAAVEHGADEEVSQKPVKEAKPAPQKQISGDTQKQKPGFQKGMKMPQNGSKPVAQEPATTEQVPAPKWWSKEERVAFDGLPLEAKKVITKKEQQAAEFVQQKLNEVAKHTNYLKEVDEAFSPHETKLNRMGIRKADAIRRFIGWQDYLEADPRNNLVEFIKTFGLTPQDLTQNQQPQQPVDPRFEELEKKYSELHNTFSQQQQAAAQAKVQAVVSDFERFKSEQDANGNLLRPHVDTFMPQITQWVTQLRQQYPQASNHQILDAAYNAVMGEITKRGFAPVNPQNEAIRQKAEAARKASGSIVSVPASDTNSIKPKGIRQALEMAYDQHSAG